MPSKVRTLKRMLLIEDDDDLARLLASRLRRERLEVVIAGDGVAGLNRARTISPDLIILDLHLPKLSGEEVCKAIREDDDNSFSHIPIIMLTSKSSEVDQIVGRVIGASRYRTKPCHFKELLNDIAELSP